MDVITTFLYILLFFNPFVPIYTNKICTEYFDRDACQQIARDQQYACADGVTSMVSCVLNIDQGLPQFTIVKPEEALLAAPLVSEKVVVIGEVSTEHPAYRTAVVVRTPFQGGFEGLRGKRFCHPGFRHDELVTEFVLEELESKIISLNSTYCSSGDNSPTIVEKKIRTLASFLGSSCRPGKWTESDDLDVELKSKYSSLCDLCGAEKCNINYQVPFNETLSCLSNRAGDIALTTIADASVFFNTSNNADNFQYLCLDGSTSDSANPCTWTNQINRLIITGAENADSVKSFVQQRLSPHIGVPSPRSVNDEIYLASLEKVLKLDRNDVINLTETITLSSYVSGIRVIPSVSSSTECNLTVRWCTLNENEQQKCRWLQQASLNAGLQPVIECTQSTDTDALSCLNNIRDGNADVAFMDVNYGYIALKKGLTVVAYPETDTRQLSSILIVVPSNYTEIRSLKDLKAQSACFPEYGGKEWLAFIDVLRSSKVLENSCDYGKLFSDFIGTSCVPGANSDDYGIENGDQSKLCSQCIPFVNTLTHSYCTADSNNKYYGSDGALRCLSAQAGSYAVISRNDVTDFVNTSNEFLVLSKNGSLAEYPGFNVDEDAALTILTAGEIVAKANSSKNADIVLLLRGIEYQFGQRMEKFFKAFETFNYTKDLLFPDSTPGLTFGGSSIKYVDNFKTLLSNSEKCIQEQSTGSSSWTIIPSTILLIVACFISRF